LYLLDTNVISELRRLERADRNVRAWASTSPASQHYISAISILEIERGMLLVERRDRRQGADLRRWLEQDVLDRFGNRILVIDTAIARRCAQLHVPNPRPERDALVAATALVHGMTLVTRNMADFLPTGVALLNPWDERGTSGEE
jgi:predicted nucleic acid-binding protein